MVSSVVRRTTLLVACCLATASAQTWFYPLGKPLSEVSQQMHNHQIHNLEAVRRSSPDIVDTAKITDCERTEKVVEEMNHPKEVVDEDRVPVFGFINDRLGNFLGGIGSVASSYADKS